MVCSSNILKDINNLGVEPCKNLAQITKKMGIKTYDDFWTYKAI